jgi:hypothetical protein
MAQTITESYTTGYNFKISCKEFIRDIVDRRNNEKKLSFKFYRIDDDKKTPLKLLEGYVSLYMNSINDIHDKIDSTDEGVYFINIDCAQFFNDNDSDNDKKWIDCIRVMHTGYLPLKLLRCFLFCISNVKLKGVSRGAKVCVDITLDNQ